MSIKKSIPHIVAIAIFALLSLVYFYPVLEGYKIKQGDTEKHKAMSHEMHSHAEKYDELALWSGNMFAGMPSYLTGTVRYDVNIVPVINQMTRLGLPIPAGTLFAYLLGFYILLLCLKINPRLAIAGAIAFGFSSYFFIIIEAGHNSKSLAIGLMAPILGGLIQVLRGNLKVGLLLIMIFTAAQVYANHLQISYYLIMILFSVWLAELISFAKEKNLVLFFKKTALVVAAALIGVLPNIGALMTTIEYSKVSTRGGAELTIKPDGSQIINENNSGLDKAYITQWSNGIDETWTLLSPNVKGGASLPILAREAEVERLRKEDQQFFNVVVQEYQQKQNAISAYFGNQPIVSGPVYIGVVLVLLAFLSLIFVRNRLIYALGGITLLAIVLSWGKNFMPLTEFFIDYVPGYNKFRAVAMTLVIVEFTVPLMAILFLDYLIKNVETVKAQKKQLFVSLSGFLLFLGLFYISPDIFVDLFSDNEESIFLNRAQNNINTTYNLEAELYAYRSDVISSSILDSLKYSLLGVLLIVLFVYGKIKNVALIVGIGAIVLVDLWIVDKQYVNNQEAVRGSRSTEKYVNWIKPEEKLAPFNPTASDQQIFQAEVSANPEIQKKINERIKETKAKEGRLGKRRMVDIQYAELMEASHYRVLNTTARLDQDVVTPYFHKSLGGYHGAKMKRYQDVIDFYLGIEHYQLQQVAAQGGQAGLNQYLVQMPITNMLNAKYIIGPSQQSNQQLYTNPYAMGNAWFVNSIAEVQSADSAITSLKKTNLREVAIVEEKDLKDIKLRGSYSAKGDVKLLEYSPNLMKYSYSSDENQLVVFSEMYYNSGWTAYFEGKKLPYFRVNYLLRAMELPAGNGEIVFKFEPTSYTVGMWFSWISSLLILLFGVSIVYSEVKKKNN